jgi:hypothetical protein
MQQLSSSSGKSGALKMLINPFARVSLQLKGAERREKIKACDAEHFRAF